MEGKCNCGAVSFTIQGALPNLYQCHCTLCQKQSGAGSNAATIIFKENFRWLKGVNKIRNWKKDTGFNSHFCEDCGSPVPNAINGKYIWIPVGLLNGVNKRIVANLWLSSKVSWNTANVALRDYEKMPENLDEFVAFLHSNSDT